MSLLALLTLTCLAAVPGHAQVRPREEPLALKVKNSISRGVRYLRETQQPNGNGRWVSATDGATALAVLALLNCGIPVTDPAVSEGLKYLRGVRPDRTYTVALQTMVFAETRSSEDLERIQENVKWLLARRVYGDGLLRGWPYSASESSHDNSNTQFALLGLWAGKQAGVAIDDKVWREIRDYYKRTQNKDGGWGYQLQNRSKLSMTTAGLCGLLISGMEADAGREVFVNGAAQNCGVYEENKEITLALEYIGDRIRYFTELWPYYNLYGIERAGRLSGLRYFGNHDWYREGSEHLVGKQADNGSWGGREQEGTDPVIDTSFALLFLAKGRTPVLISKVVHTDRLPRDLRLADGKLDTDWNNDRNDLRNLTQFASKELFAGTPLAWLSFDIHKAAAKLEQQREERKDDDAAEEALQDVISDMLTSPILYINGHKSPLHRFTAIEKELLRKYVDNGGFLLVEACCGRPEFDRGFRALAEELWPRQLKPVEAGHPVWTSKFVIAPNDPYKLEHISLGCKTVLIYAPQDMSCLWESNNQQGLGDRAFKLGANIIAYATGLEPPQPRLTKVEIAGSRDAARMPRGYFKAAQLKHNGEWQPAPQAMRNLLDHLRKHAGLDVALKTENMVLSAENKSIIDYKFVYLHGRKEFSFAADQLKHLRFNLENGGLLFADACCGKPAFDKSFRKFMAELFPGRKLEDVPLNDVLYSKELNGVKLDETTIKCRMKATGPGDAAGLQAVPPMLEGIKIDNRWAVLYSKYDIGCALERHRSSDCLGYDPDSAFKIAGAAVLYLLKL